MGTRWQNLFFVLTFLGLNRAQQLSSFGRRAGGLPVGLGSSFGSRFRLSSGSGLRPAPSGAWFSSPSAFGSSSSQLTGSTSPRRISTQGGSNRLVLGRTSSFIDNNNNNALSLTSFPQQPIQSIQPHQVHQVHAVHQPQQAVISQTRQVLSQPRQVLPQPRQVLSQPQAVLQHTQHVQPQPHVAQTVQQVQPIPHVQQSLQQQLQIVQTAPAAIQTPSTGSHVTAQQSVIPGIVPQSIGLGVPASPAAGMVSPLGIGSPMGMAGAMNPMAAMMGMGPMSMGMGPMGMGMPFMSYDTMEDLLLDGPDQRPVPAGAAMAAAAASSAVAGAGLGAGIAQPARTSVPVASAPAAGQTASAASVGLGHLAGSVTAPVAATGTQGTVSAAQVDPSLIQSALQTALSRVQQRQSPQTQLAG